MSWTDKEPGRAGLSLGQLSDGESIRAQIVGEPFWQTHEIDQGDGSTEEAEALHVPVNPLDVPDGYTDMSGEELDDDAEYAVINSSSSFYQALMSAFGVETGQEPPQLNGQIVSITAYQPSDQYSRFFEVEAE